MGSLATLCLTVLSEEDKKIASDKAASQQNGAAATAEPEQPSSNGSDTKRAAKRKLNQLSIHQKYELIQAKTGDSKLTLSQLQELAYEKFQIRPSVQSISDILKREQAEKIREHLIQNPDDTSSIRKKISRVHGLNEALAGWLRETGGAGLTDDIMIAKAKELGSQMQLPPDFKYSRNNWLADFKKNVRAACSIVAFLFFFFFILACAIFCNHACGFVIFFF
jgi:hypothetical protein